MSERDNKPKTGAPELEEAPTPEEIAEATRLRDALEGKGASSRSADVAIALRAAWSPTALADATHAEMLDDVPTSAGEMAAATAHASALGTKEEPDIVSALRAAWAPADLPGSEHDALVRTAIASPAPAKVVRFPGVRRIAAVATTVLAAAAVITVWLGSGPSELPLARARSTTPLFDQPFGDGNASARIDRIAVARAADYRDNRFAQWGIR